MRVHIVTPTFRPVTGGQETRIHELGTRLAAKGHEVHVHTGALDAAGRPLPAEDKLDGLAVHRYAPRFRVGHYLQSWTPRIEVAGETVVEAQGYPHLAGDATERAYGSRAPFVMTPVGTTIRFEGAGPRALRWAYDHLRGVPTMRRARRLILLTRAEVAWLEAHGIDASKARVVPGAAAEHCFQPRDPRPARERHGDYVLLLGRLGAQKNPVQLVEALALLKEEFPDLRAVLAGPDEGEGTRALRRARALGLGARVVLAGPVSEDQKLALLAGARALALPSLWEGMPLTIFEAWAQRRAVVASAVDGIAASVEDGRTGLLAPRGDTAAFAGALRRVLRDPALAQRLGEEGRALADREHRWGPVADRLEAVYREALGTGPRP